MTIMVMQLVCPERHAMIGGPYDDTVTPREEVEAGAWAKLREVFGEKPPICGLCQGMVFHIEHGRALIQDLDLMEGLMLVSGFVQQMSTEELRDAARGRRPDPREGWQN